MSGLIVGGGVGQPYIKEDALFVPAVSTGRNEKVIVRHVGNQVVTVVVRDRVAPTDPYMLLLRATLYTKRVPNSVFPAPPVSRQLKEILIRGNQ